MTIIVEYGGTAYHAVSLSDARKYIFDVFAHNKQTPNRVYEVDNDGNAVKEYGCSWSIDFVILEKRTS